MEAWGLDYATITCENLTLITSFQILKYAHLCNKIINLFSFYEKEKPRDAYSKVRGKKVTRTIAENIFYGTPP
jgi:hypothetical protein